MNKGREDSRILSGPTDHRRHIGVEPTQNLDTPSGVVMRRSTPWLLGVNCSILCFISAEIRLLAFQSQIVAFKLPHKIDISRIRSELIAPFLHFGQISGELRSNGLFVL
jgi:hypothetical protein